MNAVAHLDSFFQDASRPAVLATIAARASSLWERLDRELVSADAAEATRRWQRWQHIAGGEAALARRLQWDSITPEQARVALLTPAESTQLPRWSTVLAEIMRTAQDHASAGADPVLQSRAPLPFEDLLVPVIHVARRRLAQQVQSAHPLRTTALHQMERSLLERLGRLCVASFHTEFVQELPFGEALLSAFDDETPAAPSTDRYITFVARHLSEGYRSLFLTYPVLARLIATAVEFWVEATAEFIDRLATDMAAITQTLNEGRAPGQVTSAEMSLSDPHRRGRSVAILTFEHGLQLVYKPKDVALERIFGDFIDWCNARSDLPSLRTARVLDCGSYGWVEFMPQLACTDEAEPRLFHQRAGMLLAVLYTLRATDCHYENIVAHGAHPVLVDMETLLHHEPKLIDDSPLAQEIEGVAVQTFWDSVLRTGLLPRWEVSQDLGSTYDISGFGGAEGRSGPRRIAQWQAVNTDSMRLVDVEVPTPLGANVARLGEHALSPHDYQHEIVQGFTQMYDFLRAHADELLADDSPLESLRSQAVRFIFRPTRTYGAILEAALAPERLTDGADFSIELDHMARAFLVAQEKPAAFPILRAEHRAMHQLDVPLFMASANAEALTMEAREPMRDYFRSASFEDVRQQIMRLSDADRARQVALINGAFDAKIATVASRSGGAWHAEDLRILTSDEFIAEARRIGLELESRAIPEADGSVNWIGLDFIPHVERFQQQVLNNSLCDGRGGIALFLSALAAKTDEERFATLARNALRTIRRQIHTLDRDTQQMLGRFNGMGGATGIPSIIYSLVRTGAFLKDPALIDDAERLLDWITPELITADEHLDVMSGAAGAILAFTTLYERTGSTRALDTARACATHLIAKQGTDPQYPLAWKTFWQRPLTGFSHGAAGAAYALFRLFSHTHDDSHRVAAEQAVAYEAALYDRTNGNWPDYRRSGDGAPGYVTRWCHGAPGIGLARLGSLRHIEDAQIRLDIDRALATTASCNLNAIDHLCCGNFGRIEVLLVGGMQYQRSYWRDTALLNATNVVERARRKGAYQLFPNLPVSVFNPGFLAGSAGIGYQLLRLADQSLPSVLLWE